MDPSLAEYSRLAERYDSRWSFYVEATTRETLARVTIGPADRVLDVGCGTGVLLQKLHLGQPRTSLAGVDAVPEMLEVAHRRLPPSVDLRVASADRLPFADGSFDAVVSCNVFHYLREPVTALREMLRVLRPGGAFVLTDWCDDYLACHLCTVYLRRLRRARIRVYGERECRRLLAESGAGQAAIDRYKISWLWGLMTARVTKGGGADKPR